MFLNRLALSTNQFGASKVNTILAYNSFNMIISVILFCSGIVICSEERFPCTVIVWLLVVRSCEESGKPRRSLKVCSLHIDFFVEQSRAHCYNTYNESNFKLNCFHWHVQSGEHWKDSERLRKAFHRCSESSRNKRYFSKVHFLYVLSWPNV